MGHARTYTRALEKNSSEFRLRLSERGASSTLPNMAGVGRERQMSEV